MYTVVTKGKCHEFSIGIELEVGNFGYLFICWDLTTGTNYTLLLTDHQSHIRLKEVKKDVSLGLLQITWKLST